jgi:hypothetical protein
MSDNHGATCTRDTLVQNIAAELTSAVYPLVLRQGIRGSWLDLELGLWRTLVKHDVLEVVSNGILSDAAQATVGGRVPSATPTSAVSEGPPHS